MAGGVMLNFSHSEKDSITERMLGFYVARVISVLEQILQAIGHNHNGDQVVTHSLVNLGAARHKEDRRIDGVIIVVSLNLRLEELHSPLLLDDRVLFLLLFLQNILK